MRAALILLVGLASVATARAQNAGAPRPDETALRYYAAQKQPERAAAEAERLRRQHPGWRIPTDLWTREPGGEDEGPLWDHLAADRLAVAQAAIEERGRAEPGWKPSPALSREIGRRELIRSVLALAKAGRWGELATLADRRRGEIEAGDVELALAAAEGFARTERVPEAFGLLDALMRPPLIAPEARRAILLHAMAFLPMGEIDRLAGLATPEDRAAIRNDLTRGRIGALLHGEAAVSVATDDLAAFEAYAEDASDPSQPALVAWLALKRNDLPSALAWFKRALGRGGDAMAAHGLAHTLDRLGYRREAEDVAYAWREPLVHNTLLFIDLLERDLTRANPPPIEAERLRRYAQVVAATASGEGAQALAWYAYNTCQFDTALGWFKRAVAWFPKETSVYGYALSLRRLHQEQAFLDVVNRYDGLFPKVVDLLFRRAGERATPCGPLAHAASSKPVSGWLELERSKQSVARVPAPDEVASDEAPPRIARSAFPIAVASENDLRAAPSGMPEAPELITTRRQTARLPSIARRVPGVGPMPYERFGFALRPAWNGQEGASAPTFAEKPAPVGSLWADERANRPAPADTDRTGSIRTPSFRLGPRS